MTINVFVASTNCASLELMSCHNLY